MLTSALFGQERGDGFIFFFVVEIEKAIIRAMSWWRPTVARTLSV